jgi:hypothetical protein
VDQQLGVTSKVSAQSWYGSHDGDARRKDGGNSDELYIVPLALKQSQMLRNIVRKSRSADPGRLAR